MNLGLGLRLGAQLRGGTSLAGVGYELWVLAGQSNMVAFAQNSPVTSFPSGVLQVSRNGALSGSTVDNQLIAAVHPLDNLPLSGTPYNLADKFAVDWQADALNSGKTLVLLPCAQGGTSIQDGDTWSAVSGVGTRLADMVARINTFFTNYPGATMGGFLWHQGESTVSTAYTRMFEHMREYVIANCPNVTGETPWVAGGPDGGTIATPFNCQEQFPNAIPYTAFAPSTGTVGTGDGLHFTKADLDIMGERYYAQVANARANNAVDLGLANPYGFRDFANNTWAAQGMTVTSITGGHNFALVAAANPRRCWQIIPAGGLVLFTPYRIRFTAERDDATDNIFFGFGPLQTFTLNQTSLNIPVNTPTNFDYEVSTVGSTFTSGFYFGLISNGGPTATNVKITNLRVTRTIEE